jgi:hypothetical protein
VIDITIVPPAPILSPSSPQYAGPNPSLPKPMFKPVFKPSLPKPFTTPATKSLAIGLHKYSLPSGIRPADLMLSQLRYNLEELDDKFSIIEPETDSEDIRIILTPKVYVRLIVKK